MLKQVQEYSMHKIYFRLFFLDNSASLAVENTGSFIMYTGITKFYYRKTVEHVFTEPVQTEGATQSFPPVSFFNRISYFCR
jgi:hypothetical protein